MNPAHQPDGLNDLQQRRGRILRDFGRANSAALAVLLAVIALALFAIIAAFKSQHNAARALAASQEARIELWEAKLAQARANRISGSVGSRLQGLAAIEAAAKIRPNLELRNEAIGLLALTDLEEQPVFWRHATNIDEGSLSFDADLQRYAWGDLQGVIHLHSMEDNRELARFQGPPARVRATLFSPDGRFLAARFNDAQFQIWSCAAKQLILATHCGFNNGGFSLSFNADSQVAAVADGARNAIRFFQLPAATELPPLVVPEVTGFDLNPTAPLVAFANAAGTIQVWNWKTQQLIETNTATLAAGHLMWSSDGQRLVSNGDNGKILVLDRAYHRTNFLSGHSAFVSDVFFDRQDQLIASRSWDGTSRLWDSRTGQLLLTTQRGYAMSFSADGQRLAFLRERSGVGWWRVFRSKVYRAVATGSPQGENLDSLAFDSSGLALAISSPAGIHVFHPAQGREIAFIPAESSEITIPVYFPPGRTALIYSTPRGLQRLSIASDSAPDRIRFDGSPRLLKRFGSHQLSGFRPSVDGKAAVLALDRSYAELIDLDTGRTLQTFTNIPGVHSVAVSPDKHWVVTATRHGSGPKLWNALTGELVRQLDHRDGNALFSPDGRWLALGFGYEVVLWDTQSWSPSPGLPRDITSGLAGQIDFSRDSRWLAMLKSEGLLQLVDVPSHQVLATFNSPNHKNIGYLAFSPDGQQIAACTATEAQVWNLALLQRRLAQFDLNWSSKPAPPISLPLPSSSPSAFFWPVLLAGSGVLVALGFLLVMWRRNQEWLRDYTSVETMAALRTRELQFAQNEILQSQKMKALGTLAAGIAHDFNNLLSVIRMANKSIARETGHLPAIAEDTRDVEEAVLEGKNIVNSMLGYSREKIGPAESCSVPELAQETVALLSKQFLSGLDLTLDFDPGAPAVIGCRAKIKQILLNLIVNAGEAMEGRGRLRIVSRFIQTLPQEPRWILRPRPAHAYVELLMTDSGPGIPPEMSSRIFEPYFTTKTSGGLRGTGLGLYLVYASAQAEGFGIAIESTPGSGTTFRISMPADPQTTSTCF